MPADPYRRLTFLAVVIGTLIGMVPSRPAQAATTIARVSGEQQESGGSRRSFTVTARKYAFAPARIEVDQDDLVKITLRSDDIAHSFTIDGYRIARRVGPGQTTVFEFRAHRAGEFPFYCNLTIDDGCRQMRGLLVVKPH